MQSLREQRAVEEAIATRWRMWVGVGLMAWVLGSLGLVGHSGQQSIRGGDWLENAVWLRTYLIGQSLAYASSSKLIATPAGFGQILLYSAEDGKLVRVLRGHTAGANYLSFSRDGKLLASASGDKTIALWDPSAGRVLRTMTRHDAPVNVVLFADDDRQLISIGEDRRIRFWRVADGIQIRQIEGDLASPVFRTAVSPSGSLIAMDQDKEIKILDLTDGQVVRTLTGHRAIVTDLEFSPDGQVLASSSCAVEFGRVDEYNECPQGEIRLWDLSRGQPIAIWDKGHSELVEDITFSPDGKLLAAVDRNRDFALWQIADATKVWTLSDSNSPVVFSPDGQFLALDSKDGISIRRVADGTPVIVLGDYGFRAVFSSDGRMLITASVHIRFWDIATGKLVRTLTWHTDVVLALGISPDGKRLVSGSADRTIKLWRVEDGSLIGSLLGYTGMVTSVAFSPDDRFVISAGEDGVAAWNVDNLR